MIIPSFDTELNGPDTTSFYTDHGGISGDGWSSLIGIVTAIVGNILISFALNIQRYAHIRLGREHEDSQKKRTSSEARRNASKDYGTQQRAIAEERAKANLDNGRDGEDFGEGMSSPRNDEDEEAQETDALIPRLHGDVEDEDEDEDYRHKERRASSVKQKSYLKSPYWWTGIILMTVGEAGNFLAYGFAPASIVSPLGVVALISNCIIAPIMLKEPFRKRDFLGVAIAVAGAVTVVLSANDSNPKLGPGEIWTLISAWEFETYFGITVAFILVLMAASNKYGQKSIFIDLGLVGLFGKVLRTQRHE